MEILNYKVSIVKKYVIPNFSLYPSSNSSAGFFLDTFLLLQEKGTKLHNLIENFFMLLMLGTSLVALFMPAQIGPKFLGHFAFINFFCLLVLYSVPSAYFAAQQGNIVKHRANMIGLFIGGILIAGAFALMPGRLLHSWLS